jgi:hypothetical protein
VPDWSRVLTAVATYARQDLPSLLKWNMNAGVTAVSESFGGFLLAQACANIDPNLVQVSFLYNDTE